jgi:hypothetical protein
LVATSSVHAPVVVLKRNTSLERPTGLQLPNVRGRMRMMAIESDEREVKEKCGSCPIENAAENNETCGFAPAKNKDIVAQAGHGVVRQRAWSENGPVRCEKIKRQTFIE